MKEEREMMREYSKKSVWPRVEWILAKGHKVDRSLDELVISLTNSGVGPAIITDVKISYKGQVANNWWDVFAYQEIPDSIETYVSNRNFNNRILKIGETLEILNLNGNLPLANAFYDRYEGLEVEIYYESIYNDQWKFDRKTTIELEDFKGLDEKDQFE